MKFNKKSCLFLILLLALAVILGGSFYLSTHVFVGRHFYPENATSLDLHGTDITTAEYDTLSAALPGCSISWDVPFRGTVYPNDTHELTVTGLTDEDLDDLRYFPELQTLHAEECTDYTQLEAMRSLFPSVQLFYNVEIGGAQYPQDAEQVTISSLSDDDIALLAYLPELTSVDASGCSDLPRLKALQEQYPDLSLSYPVSISGASYDRFTEELTLAEADAAELTELFFHMPLLSQVTLLEPKGSAEDLLSLVEAYPGIVFTWQKEVFGIPVSSLDTEVDLSDTQPDSLEQIRQEMAYFPNAEKLILCGLEFDNESMAAFREQMREEYKVVWNVEVGYLTVRTDEIYYMPGKYDLGVTEEQAYNLRYCEDMICIDVGHKPLFTCDWAAFMPHLKYLIIADTMISDISPLEGLTELIYLEMFITKVTDLTPLLSCTALQDLNLCYTHADPEPVKQMTWLNNLWWAESPIEVEEFQQYLPDTHLMFLHHSSTGNGWRQLQNYYDMRDILGMHYMWG